MNEDNSLMLDSSIFGFSMYFEVCLIPILEERDATVYIIVKSYHIEDISYFVHIVMIPMYQGGVPQLRGQKQI